MFGTYPKPVKYKNPTVQYMCEHLGRTLVSLMLNLKDPQKAVLSEGDSEALQLMYELYTSRVEDCGQGIAVIQFTAMGGYDISVAESIREGDYVQARRSSEYWRDVESGRIDPMGW